MVAVVEPGARSAAGSASFIALLPQYLCHKQVRAAKIVSMTADDKTHGVEIVLELPAFRPHPEKGDRLAWKTSQEWYAKHSPQPGGYVIAYEDGYVSYSPAKAFEDGYAPIVDKIPKTEGLQPQAAWPFPTRGA